MTIKNIKYCSGFTLIELMIVITLTVMLMIAASSVFMIFLVGDSKTVGTQLVKQEGQQALWQMELLIRNAIELIPNDSAITCGTGMSQLRFQSLDGGTTTLEQINDGIVAKIASTSSSLSQSFFLTSDNVTLISGPVFNCSRSVDQTKPHISLTFTLRKDAANSGQTRDIVEEIFSTSTSIRSF